MPSHSLWSPENACSGINHTSDANSYVHATQQSNQIQENKIKIMIANSEMKDKFKIMLEVIWALELFSFLVAMILRRYLWIIKKPPITITWKNNIVLEINSYLFSFFMIY